MLGAHEWLSSANSGQTPVWQGGGGGTVDACGRGRSEGHKEPCKAQEQKSQSGENI